MNHPAAAHVVLLATKYVWLAAAIWSGVVSGLAASTSVMLATKCACLLAWRSAVSISSRLVAGFAASTSVTTVAMVRTSRSVRQAARRDGVGGKMSWREDNTALS